MPRRFTDSENSGDYNWHRLWVRTSKKSQRRYARAWVHPLSGDLPISEALAILEHPTGPSKLTSCPTTQQTIPLKTSSSSGTKRWRKDKRSRLDRWPSCANTRTDCGRIMSACEPVWRPARLRNYGDLPTHFLHLVLTKARRPLYPTTLTYRRMTSYLPTDLRSHDVHHPQTPWKPNPEKGPLVDPADPSVPRNAGYGEKPVGTDASQSQLMNMCPNDPGASPHQYHPCTPSSGFLPPHTCFSPPPS